MPFGRDPNDLTNARGRLPNDRPHMFRLMGTVDMPRTGVVIAANLQHFSGKPWAATAQIDLPQDDQRVLLEPRGSRRLSSQSLLDLRVSRTIPLRRSGRVELLLDVLNVLNDAAEEGLATSDDLFSPNFGQPTRLHGSAARDVRCEVEPGPVSVSYFGSSIKTMFEFCRERSNTMYFPSGVMSNVRSAP